MSNKSGLIYTLVGSYFFFCLLLAFMLAGANVQPGQFGTFLRSALTNTSRDMLQFTLRIPDIPTINFIETLPNDQWWQLIVNVLIFFVNTFFGFINGLISVLNFVITMLNLIIQFLQFLILVIKNMILNIVELISANSMA